MKEAQLKKLGAMIEAIDAVVNDPEFPVNRVLVEMGNGEVGVYTSGSSPKNIRPVKKEYSEEELKERAAEHARLSNAIESYRIHELQANNKILVTTTHLAAALKKTKYDVINHLKNLVKNDKLKYIIQSFCTKADDPEYKKNVKLIDFNELATIENELPTEEALFVQDDVKTIANALKNGIQGSEDMIAPM